MRRADFLLPFIFFSLWAILLVGCTKHGVLGPQGVPGAQGPEGPQGKDGNTLLSGGGVPLDSLGKPGDFYLDTVSLTLFGPKQDGSWGAGIVLRGKAGSLILKGQGAPDPEAGQPGDYYIDTRDGSLYGPKDATGWGAAVTLINPDEPVEDTSVTVFTFKDNPWQAYGNIYQITQSFPQLSDSVVERGAILVYARLSDGFWFQLPFWFNGRVYYTNFSQHVFTIYSPDPGTGPVIPEDFEEVKVIILHADRIVPVDLHRSHLDTYFRAARILARDRPGNP